MPRKSTPAPASKAAPINEQAAKEQTQAANQLAVIEMAKRDYGQDRDLVNQLLGQIQMSRAISKFTDVVSLSKLQQIKEKKLYRGAAGQKAIDSSGNEITDVGTWAGFCAALGVSASKVDEDLANLREFGEDALEQLNSVGVGYRDLRQFRKLPADQKTALIEAAKAGDNETLLELAEDLIAKHSKEKSGLLQEVAAKDQRIARHAARIAELEDAADRLAALPVHEQVATSGARALGVVQGELRQGLLNLDAHHKANGGDGREVMAGYLGQLQKALNELREEFAIADHLGDGTPAWKRWAAQQGTGQTS